MHLSSLCVCITFECLHVHFVFEFQHFTGYAFLKSACMYVIMLDLAHTC